MDERKRAIGRAFLALKYQFPEIEAAFERWRETAEAAGLDPDEVNDDSPEHPAEVRAAYRNLEALEAALQARVAGLLEAPLGAGTAGTPAERVNRSLGSEGSPMHPKNIRRLYDRVYAVLGVYSSFRDDELPMEPVHLTMGDFRDLAIVLENCRKPGEEKEPDAAEQHADA